MHDFSKPYNFLSVFIPILLAIMLFLTVFTKANYEVSAIWAGAVFLLLAIYRTYTVYLRK